MKQAPKKYHILALGCQMNKSDSERLAAIFEFIGFIPTDSDKNADIIAAVACSVRQTAVDRIHGKIRKWQRWKKSKNITTILTGCVLPNDKKIFSKKFDIIIDIKDIIKIPKILFSQFSNLSTGQARGSGKGLTATTFSEYSDYLQVAPEYSVTYRAYVPIMTGCDNFCSYCVVPYARGREKSRNINDVLSEIRTISEKDCLEIVLLGQNVNAYKPKDIQNFSQKNPYKNPFAALLWEINQINGVKRIHFTAPHPKDMTSEAIDALSLPKQVRFLHLPIQSGDNDILKKMNRRYTAEHYLNLINKIKEKNPNIALGTDIIVGFSGETKKQFENTLKLYKKVEFDISYNAIYSERKGTLAAKLYKDNVSLVEKRRRWKKLQTLMETITKKQNAKFLGKTVCVLVDKWKNGYCYGNSKEYKLVRFKGEKNFIGKEINIVIQKTDIWLLEGVILMKKETHKEKSMSSHRQ